MTDRRPMARPEEVAEYLQVPLETVYFWRKRGIGPRVSKVGRYLRYKWTDVDAWVEAQSAVAA